MPLLPQDLVHKFETAMSGSVARGALAVLAVLALIGAYDWRVARNFSTAEAMDTAQLARNISEGKGYTTKFIRPFSMFLIKRANQERLNSLSPEQKADLCQVNGAHPDIANPPVYPVVLAGWMKIAPFRFDLSKKPAESFARYQPDYLIALLNQSLFVVLAVFTFFLARKLFDAPVAWLSAIVLFGTEVLWRFSVSGLPTILLLLLFLALVWSLIRFEAATADATASSRNVLGHAVLIGLLLGAGLLTRYAYGVLLVPVIVYVLVFAGRWRMPAVLLIVGTFAVVATPWIARNVGLCGEPFGTAGYALLDGSAYFPQHRLERSLSPNLAQIQLAPLGWKFVANLKQIVVDELPQLGGGWVAAFFLVGLMFGFRNAAITRCRYFTLAALVTLVLAQAIGRTALADDSPGINSQNLLVLLLPLIVIYAVSFFYTLLDQVTVPFSWLRVAVIVVFCGVATLPLTLSFVPSKSQPSALPAPVVFPPYYPPDIQKVSNWMGENELMMSDAPWAVAWYGRRDAVWLTLDAQGEFYTMNDYIKPVRALYLTPVSLDAKLLSQWVRGGSDRSWGELIIGSMTREELPRGFPLVKSKRLPEQLFFSDWERWLKADGTPAGP